MQLNLLWWLTAKVGSDHLKWPSSIDEMCLLIDCLYEDSEDQIEVAALGTLNLFRWLQKHTVKRDRPWHLNKYTQQWPLNVTVNKCHSLNSGNSSLHLVISATFPVTSMAAQYTKLLRNTVTYLCSRITPMWSFHARPLRTERAWQSEVARFSCTHALARRRSQWQRKLLFPLNREPRAWMLSECASRFLL